MKQTELTITTPTKVTTPIKLTSPIKVPPHTKHHGRQDHGHEERKYSKIEGIRVMIGGILIHFVLGTFYLWGGISLYVASYLRSYEPELDIDTVKLAFPLMNIVMNTVLSFGLKIAEKIGVKPILTIGIVCIALANFIVSFLDNFVGFLLIYAILVGLSSGMMYMVPIVCAWKYFPDRKGLVSGFIVAGYGFGSFTFNFIALALVNPNNQKATVESADGHKYFDQSVYSRVPMMFRYLALIYLIIGLTGMILVKKPKEPLVPPKNPQDEHNSSVKQEEDGIPELEMYQCQSVKQGIKSSPFWLLVGLVVFGSFYGLLMANNYKVYGIYKLGNDTFVTTVGSIGSAVNGCSRLIWAYLLDKFGFRRVYFVLMGIQAIVSGTLSVVSEIPALYLIWFALTMGTEGGQFSMMPAVTAGVFGSKKGPLIYGIIFFGFAIANLCAFLLTKFGMATLGWVGIFWICFGFSCVALILNFIFDEDYEFPPVTKTTP